jgi:hypothetical protein
MNLPEEIAEGLGRLGDTREQVAETLLANHVQGVRDTVRTLNPVVRFIHIHLKNEDLDLDVIPGHIIRYKVAKQNGEVALPKPVMQFLDAFNAGKHPELELPLERA